MTENQSTALMDKETPKAPAIPAEETLAITPAPGAGPASLEKTLRRLEEQSAIRTELALKRLFWVRLGSVFLGVTMAVVMLTAATLMPRVQASLDATDVVMDNLTQLSQRIEEADLPAILENLDQTLTQSRASLGEVSGAMESISAIDFAGLSEAIQDLQRVLRNPLGSLFGRG